MSHGVFVVLQGKVVPWPADVEVMAAALRIWAPVTHCVMQGACTALFVLYLRGPCDVCLLCLPTTACNGQFGDCWISYCHEL